MNVNTIKYMMHVIMGLVCTSFSTPCGANVTFTNFGTSFLLNATNSKLYVNNPAKVTGWGQYSIVKAYGDVASSSWPEGYAAGSIVGQTGASSVTKPTRTNLVDANSNAINTVGVLLRTTSNLLLYTARTYSSSMVVLRRRSDSSNSDIRTTSNAVNLFYQNIAVPTTDSIDGTQFMRYHAAHHVFHNNGNAWTIRGWVRFNDGFTVMPLGSVIMDTLTTVSGGFDLRDTGTLILNNDLYLSGAVTLTNGGNIKGRSSCIGQANTIFMGGDLTLSETTYARTLHITGDWSNSGTSGDLIIDGCGHTLNIGDRAQIFVDTNVTLTLRNMTIKTGPKSLNNPAIQLAALGSKLALDNVMLDLGADFHFITGQLFVHNEVAVTGTSAFVYQSPKPSYITSGATWAFEQGSTFSVAPSTFTDCPFTVNNTYTNNAFLVLVDASSALSLNGCSFQTTYTGLRLRSGMVLFDNKVAIDTTAGVDLNSTTPITEIGSGVTTENFPVTAAWSPDSRFLALTNQNGNSLQIYRFNGVDVPYPVGSRVSTGGATRTAAWSPDGKYLAVGIASTLRIYQFNGSTAPVPVGSAVSTGASVMSAIWSPDGRFVAVANSVASLQTYRFNGISTPVQIGNVTLSVLFAAWSPDGNYILTVLNGGGFNIYRFNPFGSPTLFSSTSGAATPFDGAWSADGRFIAIVNMPSGGIQIYRFNGISVPIIVDTNATSAGGFPTGVAWSPDGRFLAVVDNNSNTMEIWRFNGTTKPLRIGSSVAVGTYPYKVQWSPDGKFISLANQTSPGTLRIFRCNYYYTGQPAQGFTNGLLFGDKAKGAAYDADVQVLGNATVTIKGRVRDDSA
jgi:WD40 repeat protein